MSVQNIAQSVYLLFHPNEDENSGKKGDEDIVKCAGSHGISLFHTVPIGNPKDFNISDPTQKDIDFFVNIACAVACDHAIEDGLDYIFIAYKDNFSFIEENEIPLCQSIVLGNGCFLTHVDNLKYFEMGDISLEQILEKETN